MTRAEPTLESLKEVLLCAHKRSMRAHMREAAAKEETAAAKTALEEAERELDEWVAAHPAPQMEMFA